MPNSPENPDPTRQIIEAMETRDDETVCKLTRAHPELHSTKANGGRTPLHYAAVCGDTLLAKLLLVKGADVNARDDNGATPLHVAAYNGQKDVAELLLAKRAQVNAVNNDRMTPLH